MKNDRIDVEFDRIIALQQAGMTEAEKEEERKKDEAWIEAELKKGQPLVF